MSTRTVASELSNRVVAVDNCLKSNSQNWLDKHREAIKLLVGNYLPHGSGIDNGVHFIETESTETKLVFMLDYHHMNDNGMYDGWTNHIIRVYPTFNGINMTISGRDRNQIKEYLHDVFYTALTTELDYDKYIRQLEEVCV
jgi:hypothetical protein